MDRVTKAKRSEIMSRIRSRDTGPELLVRKRLHAAGWRYRVCDRRLPGHPDIVVPRARTLIEIRGCFWHRHACGDATMPKSNVAFWQEKWNRNVARDRRHEGEWKALGWNVIIVWACQLKPAVRERTLRLVHQALDVRAANPTRRPTRLVIPSRSA
ncbi:MAG: very short patch repair endonuclease [Kiritimatiellia bacterium]